MKRLTLLDVAILSGLLVLTLAVAFTRNLSGPPVEDASMLCRYAEHLAAGQGITWNPGEHPVDGATDFLFLVASAGVMRLGLTAPQAVRALALVSHALTVLLIYLVVRRRGGVSGVALASAVFLALGPGAFYIELGFGTPFFALWSALAYAAGLELERARYGLRFAFACLLMGLTRPEGVLIALLYLGAQLSMLERKRAVRMALTFGLVFLVFGGAYFFWRWHYFGYPLPNPLYKKAGGHFYPSSLRTAFWSVLTLTFPFVLGLGLGLQAPETRRRALGACLVVVCFAAMWGLLSDEMNWSLRFQYAIVPMVLLQWPELTSLKVPGSRWLTGAVAALALLFCARGVRNACLPKAGWEHDSPYDVAQVLRPYADRGYTMLTTEAGILPLYSRWRAVDAYGLNDQWIAHHGAITADYIAQQQPDVIMIHADYTPLSRPEVMGRGISDGPAIAGWGRMVNTVEQYAVAHQYRLAASYGSTTAFSYYYYVRPACPDADAIVAGIRALRPELLKAGVVDFTAPSAN